MHTSQDSLQENAEVKGKVFIYLNGKTQNTYGELHHQASSSGATRLR